MTAPQIPSTIDFKNPSKDLDPTAQYLSLSAQRSQSRKGKTKDAIPPCRWHLTYWIQGQIEHHYVMATWPEEAVLTVGRGFPLKIEFDDHGADRWTPIGRHLYAELHCYPKLVAQQAAIDALKESGHA